MNSDKIANMYDLGAEIEIGCEDAIVNGILQVPEQRQGLVLFAHGSGSSRWSPRNQYVARVLRDAGFATLLFDLLTREEEVEDQRTGRLRFDIELLARRLSGATRWCAGQKSLAGMRVGYFGASTGAAAALMAAAGAPELVAAIVSRGGRPDLAGAALAIVRAPTLLIVGGNDGPVMQLNREALDRLRIAEKQLVIVPGASHLFEERGALESVAGIARQWFLRYLPAAPHVWMPAAG
ncbi:MAG TPA: dienelactone hydrolase family protein [Terriglobales bacterium]|nr:dienelactone hydrolase family protein [Terriglobales bacterium]